MGASLASNAARHGAHVSVYNRTTGKTDEFIAAHGTEGNFTACKTLSELAASLPAPRSIVVMVNAGDPVDAVINELIPFLYAGDCIIDAGNSHFKDSDRRADELAGRGFHFVGLGVSGGEEGALYGPSMMAGGSREGFDRVAPLLLKMAASDGGKGKCLAYFGAGGAGHFVKMVHNGIEYADMQLIAEIYHLMKKLLNLSNAEIAEVFEKWNGKRELKSYLLEITAKIFRKKDSLAGSGELIDFILDKAGQKGTGGWTLEAAQKLKIPVPAINAAVFSRLVSSAKELRNRGSQFYGDIEVRLPRTNLNSIKDAMLLAKISAYGEGFRMLAEASEKYGWPIDLSEVSRIWRGGCIIRANLLKSFEKTFKSENKPEHLMLDPEIGSIFKKKHLRWRKVVTNAALAGIPVPVLSASLTAFDSLRTSWLPQNLTQAQRDFFGAHTFERIDRPGIFHEKWSD